IVVTPQSPGVVLNRATVVGNEHETTTANNSAHATTLVTGPFTPAVIRHGCIAVNVTTRSTTVGRRTKLTVRVTELGKPAKGIRVHVKGAGVDRLSPRSNSRGAIRMTIKPRKPGIIQVGVYGKQSCGTPRIGVVGAFTPPLTG